MPPGRDPILPCGAKCRLTPWLGFGRPHATPWNSSSSLSGARPPGKVSETSVAGHLAWKTPGSRTTLWIGRKYRRHSMAGTTFSLNGSSTALTPERFVARDLPGARRFSRSLRKSHVLRVVLQLLPTAEYTAGSVLPPHLSPFVVEGEDDYVSPERQAQLDAVDRAAEEARARSDQDQVAEAAPDGADPSSQEASAAESEDEEGEGGRRVDMRDRCLAPSASQAVCGSFVDISPLIVCGARCILPPSCGWPSRLSHFPARVGG